MQWTEVCLRRGPVNVETTDWSGCAEFAGAADGVGVGVNGGWVERPGGGQRIYLKRVREGSSRRPNVVVTNGAWALELFSGAVP